MRYLHALRKISGIGSAKIRKLVNFFQIPEKIWLAEKDALLASGIGEKDASLILEGRRKISPEKEWEKLQKEKIRVIPFDDQRYPPLLREIKNPPFLIYQKGCLEDFSRKKMIAVVGSRRNTSYGADVARSLSRGLSETGILVVSGMAMGIDSFAHRGTLENKKETVAVLGNSLDSQSIHPKINFNLAMEICQKGALLSEYPPETQAGPLTFPARNRIIAGMCLATLVVEAEEKSGALITAHMALEENREVFAVPGSIFSATSRGTNDLIKKGAKLAGSVRDVLEELLLEDSISAKTPAEEKVPENETEKTLLKIIASEPLHIDTISKIAKIPPAKCSASLSIMEMKGWIKNIGGQSYISI